AGWIMTCVFALPGDCCRSMTPSQNAGANWRRWRRRYPFTGRSPDLLRRVHGSTSIAPDPMVIVWMGDLYAFTARSPDLPARNGSTRIDCQIRSLSYGRVTRVT